MLWRYARACTDPHTEGGETDPCRRHHQIGLDATVHCRGNTGALALSRIARLLAVDSLQLPGDSGPRGTLAGPLLEQAVDEGGLAHVGEAKHRRPHLQVTQSDAGTARRSHSCFRLGAYARQVRFSATINALSALHWRHHKLKL